MDILFYLAAAGDNVDKLIGLVTFSIYSHVELQFSDGICFSSSHRDGGTRFKQIIVNSDHWHVISITVTAEQEAAIRTWCTEQLGCPYDLLAVLCIDIPGDIHTSGAWYCSEICAAALSDNGIYHYPKKLSPGYMYDLTVKP